MGHQIFVLAYSKTSYTYAFDVYLGKRGTKPSAMGIGYDVVVGLMADLTGQGYRVYTDNFYTSIPLLCSETSTCKRRQKDSKTGVFEVKEFLQPKAIEDYNKNMKGVDKSDQLIGSYNVLRNVKKYWKVFFLHLLNIAIVNSYILFEKFCKSHPERSHLQRNKDCDQLSYREAVIRQLAEIESGEAPPAAVRNVSMFASGVAHLLVFSKSCGRCRVCPHYGDKQGRSEITSSGCEVHLCVKKKRNCFAI
eukprot:gene5703-10952_t